MGLGPAVNLRLRPERRLDPGEPDAGKSISTRLLSQDKGCAGGRHQFSVVKQWQLLYSLGITPERIRLFRDATLGQDLCAFSVLHTLAVWGV